MPIAVYTAWREEEDTQKLLNRPELSYFELKERGDEYEVECDVNNPFWQNNENSASFHTSAGL